MHLIIGVVVMDFIEKVEKISLLSPCFSSFTSAARLLYFIKDIENVSSVSCSFFLCLVISIVSHHFITKIEQLSSQELEL